MDYVIEQMVSVFNMDAEIAESEISLAKTLYINKRISAILKMPCEESPVFERWFRRKYLCAMYLLLQENPAPCQSDWARFKWKLYEAFEEVYPPKVLMTEIIKGLPPFPPAEHRSDEMQPAQQSNI